MAPDTFSQRSSAAAATYEACHAVLETAELLEAILLEVPPLDLFVVQRVSAEWRDGVAASIKIQQRMFLRPVVEEERWTLQGRLCDLAEQRPDFQYSHVELVESETNETVPEALNSMDAPSATSKTEVMRQVTPAEPCPLLSVAELYRSENVIERLCITNADKGCEIRMARIVDRPGSWENMYLTNPPCKEVVVRLDMQLVGSSEIIWSEWHARNDNGLKVSDVSRQALHGVLNTIYFYKDEDGQILIGHGCTSYDTFEDATTLAEVLSRHVDSDRRSESLRSCLLSVGCCDFALPTEQERAQVREGGFVVDYDPLWWL